MFYKGLVCPECGAPITEVSTKEDFYCSYCGAKIEHKKIAQEFSGSTPVSEMINEMTLLDRAYLLLEYRDFSSANTCFDRVLVLSPGVSMAYLGKMMAVNRCCNTEELVKQYSQSPEKNELFLKALRFADRDEYEELIKLKELMAKNHDAKLQKLQESKDLLEQKREDLEKEYASKRFKGLKYSRRKALIVLLLTLSILSLSFSIFIITASFTRGNVGGYIVYTFLFIVPCLAAAVGLLIWLKQIKERKAEIEQIEADNVHVEHELNVIRDAIKKEESSWA